MNQFLKSYRKLSRRNKYLIIGAILLLSIIVFFLFNQRSCSDNRFGEAMVMLPDGTVLNTALADTLTERASGLSVCRNLASDQAMLFIFNKPDIYSFWMKNMNFPIDIFWLDEHKQIVFIHENADPAEYEEGINYVPEVNAQYVLETVAGFSQEHGMSIGNQLSW